MLPFIRSTIFFVIAMPSPVLPYLLLRLESSCVKESNIFGRKLLSMPIPVSLITKRMDDWPSYTFVHSTVIFTEPGASVNFMAFDSMLMSTCLSFMSSPI